MAGFISPQQYAEVARDVFGRPNRNMQKTKELDREIHESLIGCSYVVCSELWNMIQPHANHKLHGSHPIHLLWALLFLKCYCTLPILSRIVGTSDREFSNRSWPFVEAIHDLVNRVINFNNRWKNWNQRSQALASLDDVDCPCMEFYPFNRGMYSHKFNGPAWRYEIGYSIFGKDIVWVNGPFKAGESEITLFREAGLRNSLEPSECVECDSGYKGDFKLKNPATGANRSEREQKSAIRARHEIVNGRLKQFAVLDQVFRHLSREQHGFCFKAVVVITQLKFEFHGRLCDVDYDVVYHNH